MRLSTQQYFLQGTTAISDLNSQVSRAQQQISSGRRVQSASDDPASAARILRLESRLQIIAQYETNINVAENSIEITESTLSSIELALGRVLELVTRSENPIVDGRVTGREVEQIVDELFALSNTRDEQGDYIFSGFSTDEAAYVFDGEEYVYQGDNGILRTQISDASFISANENGIDLFEGLEQLNRQVNTSADVGNSGSFQVISSVVDDPDAFDAVYPEDYVVLFNDETDVVPAAPNYTITRVSDSSVVVSNEVYDPAVGISFDGLQLTGVGSPQPGDQYAVESVTSENMLNIVSDIAEGLRNLSGSDQFSRFIADSINDVKAIQDRLSAARTRVGVSLGRLDSTRNTLADRQLSQQALLSEVRDLDYAAAISNLSFLSFVLEASQASFSRISGLSLFNYLR